MNIYITFYYVFLRFSNSPKNSLIILFNMEEHVRTEHLHVYCLNEKNDQVLRTKAEILPLFRGEVKCRLTVYRILCFVEEFINVKLTIKNNAAIPVLIYIIINYYN